MKNKESLEPVTPAMKRRELRYYLYQLENVGSPLGHAIVAIPKAILNHRIKKIDSMPDAQYFGQEVRVETKVGQTAMGGNLI